MGWHLTGTMTLPGVTPAPVVQKQTAAVRVPKKVKRNGTTVLLGKAVVTNAGQRASAKVTWSTKKSAKGSKVRFSQGEVRYRSKERSNSHSPTE